MPKYISSYYLSNDLFILDKYIEKINKSSNNNLEKNKAKITSLLNGIVRYIEDIDIYYDLRNIPSYKELQEDIQYINENIQSNELLVLDTSRIIERLSAVDNLRDYAANDLLYKYDVDTTEDINDIKINKLNEISSKIKTNNREINYLNPCCFSRLEDPLIKESFSNIKMYCIVPEEYTEDSNFKEETYEKIIIDAQKNINNPLVTKRNIRISNGVFDILNIQPKISQIPIMKNDMYTTSPKEFIALKENIKYLRKDGVLIYTIPYTRLSFEIMLFLSKNIKDISVIVTDYKEKLITIVGYKHFNSKYEDNYKMLKELKFDEIGTRFEYDYTLPNDSKYIEFFRGGKINEKELDNIIFNDNLYDDFFKQVNDMKILTDTRPLLPFNIGQVGLVLTSGKLDGVVEEPNDRKHIIKGRTIKYTEQIQNNLSLDEETRVEKVSNKVQINAFDSAGNFIEIS